MNNRNKDHQYPNVIITISEEMNSLVGSLVIIYLSSFTTCDTVAEGDVKLTEAFLQPSLYYQKLSPSEREDLRGLVACSTTTTTMEEEDRSAPAMGPRPVDTELAESAAATEPPVAEEE